MKLIKTIARVQTQILFVGVAVIPLIFFPFVSDTLVVSKTLFLFTLCLVLLFIKTLTIVPRGRIELTFSKYDRALLGLTLAYVISGLIRTPSKMDFFLSPGSGTLILGGFLIYLFLSSLPQQDREKIRPFLIVSATLLAIFSTLTRTGVLTKIKFLPDMVRSATFNLSGDSVTAVVFLLVVIPWVIKGLMTVRENLAKALYGAALVILVLGATTSIMSAIPTKKNPGVRLPSLGLSWSVAIDTLKESPLFGAGAANYLNSFKKFRPASYNKTDIWMVHFSTSRNYYLTAITETGFLGIISLGYLLLLYSREFNLLVRRTVFNWKIILSPQAFDYIPLTILLLSLLIFPGTITLIITLFVLLALINTEVSKKTINLTIQTMPIPNKIKQTLTTKLPAILLTSFLNLVYFSLAFLLVRVTLAEIHYRRALGYIAENKGQLTYQTIQKVTKFNPYSDKYRVTYAQVNLLLSSYIIKQGNVAAEQRSVIAELSQQAVREGKAAVAINPERASNWELLGGVYKAVMEYAQGADGFAIEAYNKAISLDPVNPNLRIALGSVYYAKGNWEKAIDAFKFAVLAKPDFPNAHFNLALAFKQKGEYDNAAIELKETLKLVTPESEDYRLVIKELNNLKSAREVPSLDLPSQTPNQP